MNVATIAVVPMVLIMFIFMRVVFKCLKIQFAFINKSELRNYRY